MLVLDKVYFRAKKINRKTFYNDKKSIHQEDLTILNVYTPNSRAVDYVKQN